MYDKKQTIHYCTILSDEQWDFILEGRFSVQRQRCLHRLMTHAVRTKTVCNIKGIEITLEVGEVAASDVELAEYLKCNRKTIGKLIDSFNILGVLTTRTNNRTSIHTLHFLTGWYVGGVLLTNPHYVKPSANVKEQADGKRTPLSNDTDSDGKPFTVPDGCQNQGQEADSTGSRAAAFSSSLCSSVACDHRAGIQNNEGETDHFHTIENCNQPSAESSDESRTEAHGGTIGGADDTEQADGIDGRTAQVFSGTPLSWRN